MPKPAPDPRCAGSSFTPIDGGRLPVSPLSWSSRQAPSEYGSQRHFDVREPGAVAATLRMGRISGQGYSSE